MKPTPDDTYAIAKLLANQTLNGELDLMSDQWRPLGDRLASLDAGRRTDALETALLLQCDRDAIMKAIGDVNVGEPPPAASGLQFATVADVRSVQSRIGWTWEGWVPGSRIVGIAAFEGTGKTRFTMDLCRRVCNGLPWPDERAMTLPADTSSLWVCADGQHDELAAIADEFVMPPESVVFPALPGDPFANTSLDESDTWKAIEDAIVAVKPWCLVIDSLTYATTLDLCEQRAIAKLKTPLIHLVQRYQINVILLLHVSKEGHAFGRRIKGITRSLIHLEAPDPDQPTRLRLWVEKTFAKKPLALGVTLRTGGCDYDDSPPVRQDPDKGGRPADKREKAAAFIRDALAKQNNQIGNNLCLEWEKNGGSSSTFWRAVRSMAADGDLIFDGGKGTGKQTMLHLTSVKTQNP
jgi:hypothetical protein